MGEHEHVAGLQARSDRLVVQTALPGVGRQHHDHAGLGAGFGRRHDAKSLRLRQRAAATRLGQTDPHVLAGVAEVERVRVSLGPEAQHGDPLSGERIGIGVGVVVHASGHGWGRSPFLWV